MDNDQFIWNIIRDCLPASSVNTTVSPPAAVVADPYDGRDCISDLHPDLLGEILMRLPIKDAFSTQVLSSLWKDVWASTPLVLRDVDLPRSAQYPTPVAAVSAVLAHHPGRFRCVHLTQCSMQHTDLQRSQWPRLLLDKGIEDLVFISRPYCRPHVSYTLPADILGCSTLTSLYVGYWTFPDTAILPCSAGKLPNLRELGILYCDMEEKDFEYLFSRSTNLETMALVCIPGFPFRIRIGSRTLRCALLWWCGLNELVINAPSLERLILWHTPMPLPDDEDSPDEDAVEQNLPVIKLEGAAGLKVLGYFDESVHMLHIADKVIKVETWPCASTELPNVELFAARVCFDKISMLPAYLRCFPNLKTLHLMSVQGDEPSNEGLEFWEQTGQIRCLQTQVRKVVFHQFQGKPSEIAFLRFVLTKAWLLESLVIPLADEDPEDTHEMRLKLEPLVRQEPALVRIVSEGDISWSFHRASDLSVSDPFDCCSN